MRVLVAPDSFGGWLGSADIARRIGARIKHAGHEPLLLPLGDGGEGTAEALSPVAFGAVVLPAQGPLDEKRGALCPVLPGPRLFVEGSHALGPPTDETRSRWGHAHSGGLGALLLRARDAARDHRAGLVVGLGGSATVDGGLGLALALGLQAEDVLGARVHTRGASGLHRVHRLVGSPPQFDLTVWADVLTTVADAARVYGPQKGVPPEALPALETDLARFADALEVWAGRPIPRSLQGGGAAGGLGFALHALLGAPLLPGAPAVAGALRLEHALRRCDAVITGEGRLDPTSLEGKVVGGVVAAARREGRPVLAVVGTSTLATDAPGAPDAVFAAGAPRAEALDAAADAAAAWLRLR